MQYEAVYHAVLFSPYLAPKLLSSLDRARKVALRCVNKAMRSQVDASIKVVASPASGCSPDVLIAALVRWSGMRDLTLLAVRGADDLAPLATASLPGLTSLTVRERPAPQDPGADVTPALDMPAFSSSVAATLQVIDVGDCTQLSSINFIRRCVQLRSLWMPGCIGVSDLSPLAACSEMLEELWMSGADSVVSLAALKFCIRLRKLDLRDCNFDFSDQATITAAGAIPGLAQLLGPDSPADVQAQAALALGCLAADHAQNQATITAAGAIPALTRLRGAEFLFVRAAATEALRNLPAQWQ
ncbi:hypothetical protein FOA52_006395 [Chlamydomonas sp. UWO 241]|nr:hypothetical protein FOA52_006395 [Chlamydomonas sp. UWO 241]